MLEAFAAETVDVGPTRIFVRYAGSGPPILLLHGFPQIHEMWRQVATELALPLSLLATRMSQRRLPRI